MSETRSNGPGVAPAGDVPAGDGPGVEPWRKLDRRAVLVAALLMGGIAFSGGVPAFVALSVPFGVPSALGWVLGGAALFVLVSAGLEYVRWRHTRYRIGPERAELHTGLLLVKRRSLTRERIRTVDLTAHPLLRVFGLVKVRIGSGEHSVGGADSILQLNPVTRREGDRLRRELLNRAALEDADDPADGRLATLDPRWIRYAPLSFVAPLLGIGAGGAVMQGSEWFGLQLEVIDWVGDLFDGVTVLWMIVTLAVVLLAAGVVGALGLFVEMWWGYRLDREPGGTLRVQRGLFTSRSISIEERRLRGVEVLEPLGVRLSGAARVDAVATGLAETETDQKTDRKTLIPPAPKDVAEAVAARVLREPVSPTASARLRAHPRAARGRRLRWALGSVLGVVLPLALLGVLLTQVLVWVAVAVAVVLLPLTALMAVDAYRSLGHGLSGDYLVVRSGSMRRATVALRRDGVIGFTVKQSVFQRRAGLMTVTATTAAGVGAYSAYDVGAGEGLEFADEAVEGLLGPFLERAP
ncbi:PH domain-containing protein [Streptomyces sp. NBC_00237]|uniref:PH domain-containing protein n=1 Tax=Streptomyces sp. NBC_00237 TaxID=2975687 RepID=UPI00224D067E|nr:PH domain-containing protein [Streptomyces sp. NBC_00237]MCX5201960.1 PH domain-containing protein [Streptomyces sp. NBC_00237]